MRRVLIQVCRFVLLPLGVVVALELGAFLVGCLLAAGGLISEEAGRLYRSNLHPVFTGKPLNPENWAAYDPWYGHRKDDFGIGDRSQFGFTNKDWGTYRIFVLGGSTVQGYGAQFHESIPVELGKVLTAREGWGLRARKFEVLNAGVSGYYSPMELAFLQYEIAYYKPDMVVVLDGYNDIVNCLGRGGRKEHPARYHWSAKQRELARELGAPRLRLTLPPHLIGDNGSYVLNLLSRFAQRARRSRFNDAMARRFPGVPAASLAPIQAHLSGLNPDGWLADGAIAALPAGGAGRLYDNYVNNLLFMKQAGDALNVPVITVLQPLLSPQFKKVLTPEEGAWYAANRQEWAQAGKLDYAAALAAAHKSIAAGMESRGASLTNRSGRFFHDFSGLFRDRPETLYSDWCHYNARGNRVIAEQLAEVILARVPDERRKAQP